MATYLPTALGEAQWRQDVNAAGGDVHVRYGSVGQWEGYAVYTNTDGTLDYELAPDPVLVYENVDLLGVSLLSDWDAFVSGLEDDWNTYKAAVSQIPGAVAGAVNTTFWDVLLPLLPALAAIGVGLYFVSQHGPRVANAYQRTRRAFRGET